MALLPPTTRHDVTIQAGDDHPILLPVLDPEGAPVSVTGWSAVAQVRDREDGLLHSWSTDTGTAVCGPAGVELLCDDSETWTWHRGRYDCRITSPDGDRLVPVTGRMKVQPLRSRT